MKTTANETTQFTLTVELYEDCNNAKEIFEQLGILVGKLPRDNKCKATLQYPNGEYSHSYNKWHTKKSNN